MFATIDDLKDSVSAYRLDQITDFTDTIADAALLAAESDVRNALDGPGYDHFAELSKMGTERNASLLMYVKNLATYYVYKRIPDEQVPPRVVKDYDDTLEILKMIASGKMSMVLARQTTTNGQGEIIQKTKGRYGSDKRRS